MKALRSEYLEERFSLQNYVDFRITATLNKKLSLQYYMISYDII